MKKKTFSDVLCDLFLACKSWFVFFIHESRFFRKHLVAKRSAFVRAGGRASKELIKIYRGMMLRQRRSLMRKLTVFWPLWVNESTSIIVMIATLKSYDVKTWTLKANIARFSTAIYLCQLHLFLLIALQLKWSVALLNKLSGAQTIRIRNFKINWSHLETWLHGSGKWHG